MKACVACCMVLLMSLGCEGAVLQLQGDKASLQVNEESLRSVVELFEAQGVSVVLDPALAENKITGTMASYSHWSLGGAAGISE